jgi:hypothetical protein
LRSTPGYSGPRRAKLRPGYANFAADDPPKLVLNSPGNEPGGTINHLGVAANTLFGAWWLDGAVALGIAGWAVIEGRRAWAGRSCGCAA